MRERSKWKPGGRAHQLEETAVEEGPMVARSKSVCLEQSEGKRQEVVVGEGGWGRGGLGGVGLCGRYKDFGFYCE